MIESVRKSLQDICKELNRYSLNYRVDIEIFDARAMAGSRANDIIASAIGDTACLGKTFSVTNEEVLKELDLALSYSDGESVQPNHIYFGSTEFKRDKGEILANVEKMLEMAEYVVGFWLESGHPFYPVFWDFAFILEIGKDAYVFMGSSSD